MEQSLHNAHDKGYKYLLGTKRLFVQLLRCFVKEGWAQKIEPEDVELVKTQFILQDFEDKIADLVYKVKMDDDEVYFYLLELQSSVDHQMPYRLLLYMVEIWREILKNTTSKAAERKDFRLPVVIPCVLYNGVDNWTVVRSFRESLARQAEFGEFVLDFKYLFFDVRRYNDDDLLQLANVIGTAFFVDKTKDKENEISERLGMVAASVQKLPKDDFNVFWVWLENIATQGLSKQKKVEFQQIIQKERTVDNMIYAFERVIKHEKLEAEAKGKLEGKLEIAKKLLQENVSPKIIEKVTELPLETIQN